MSRNYITFTSAAVPPHFLVRTLQPSDTHYPPLFEPEIGPDTITIDIVNTGAFGSGAHPTTQTCLTALAENVTSSSSVLDFGCGSGVLAIAAAKLGARTVVAVDIDQAAVIRTQDNAALNGVEDHIAVRFGSAEAAMPDAPYSVIVGNLLTPIILKVSPLLPPLLAPDGVLILSGILDMQADRVRDGLALVGLTARDSRSKSGWCTLIAARSSEAPR